MPKTIFLLLFSYLIQLVKNQDPSPCPEVFSVEPGRFHKDHWYGVINLKSEDSLEGIRILVVFDHPTEYLGNWFGDCVTMNNQKYVIKDPKYLLEKNVVLTIRFFIHYDPDGPIPSLVKINLNGKNICLRKQLEDGATTPKLHISELVRGDEDNSQEKDINVYGEKRRSSRKLSSNSYTTPSYNYITPRIYNNLRNLEKNELLTTEASDSVSNNKNVLFPGDYNLNIHPLAISKRSIGCGTVGIQANPLITYGHHTIKGQWPWHTAIYANGKYICGGTLISEKHILTAGHCITFQERNVAVDPKLITVAFGKHCLSKSDSDVQLRQVEKIFLHPEYNHTVYFNDIAILTVNHPVEINNFVRPCCLWEGDVNNATNLGTVVGWGFDENHRLSDTLMQTKMPIVDQVKCIYSNSEFFATFTFEKNFCAGFRNRSSVCNGDSGGGMVFTKPTNTTNGKTIWQIRGIVSVSVAIQEKILCDSSQYIVFTDVAKHLDWIKRTIET